MKWISVKDRIPYKGDLVLVFFEDGVILMGSWDDTNIQTFEKGKLGWWCYYLEGRLRPHEDNRYQITHWMPLPKPPTV